MTAVNLTDLGNATRLARRHAAGIRDRPASDGSRGTASAGGATPRRFASVNAPKTRSARCSPRPAVSKARIVRGS